MAGVKPTGLTTLTAMKSYRLLLGALFTFSLLPLAPAAEKKEAPADRDGALVERIKRIGEELNLSEDQREKVRTLMQEELGRMRELREDQTTPREEKMTKYREAQEKLSAKMKDILNPEQFAKWEKLRPGAAGPAGAGNPRERMQQIFADLNLSSEQQEKVRSAMQGQGEKMRELRDASPEERREKFQKFQEEMNAKMKEILTPEQFEKWQKARAELGGRPGAGPGEGAPKRRRPDAK